MAYPIKPRSKSKKIWNFFRYPDCCRNGGNHVVLCSNDNHGSGTVERVAELWQNENLNEVHVTNSECDMFLFEAVEALGGGRERSQKAHSENPEETDSRIRLVAFGFSD
jgi:hypothetical protein